MAAVLEWGQIQHGLGQVTLTERLDRWTTHPIWGLGILGAAAALMFFLVYAVGAPLQGLMEDYLVTAPAAWVTEALQGAPGWVVSLLTDGIIGGAGTMLTIPILAISLLWASSRHRYMARAAFNRFMHPDRAARALIPAAVPRFRLQRSRSDGSAHRCAPRARLLSILLAPLVPCTTRLGSWPPWRRPSPQAFVVT